MDYKVLCLIPARSGSKSIPNKNILNYDGIPMLAWSIIQALKLECNKKIVVSTDSELYQEIAIVFGAECPFLRPKEISDDLSTDLEFIKHALDWLKINENYSPDIIVQLRPTYPNRNSDIIQKCIDLFIKNFNKYDSLRTIIPFDKSPYKMYNIIDDKLIPLFQKVNKINEPYNQARQLLPKTYLHNGYIDIIKYNTIYDFNSVTGEKILPYLMSPSDDNDIDTFQDLQKSLEKNISTENEYNEDIQSSTVSKIYKNNQLSNKKKIIHLHGNSTSNSGDLIISISTKKYFCEKILNSNINDFEITNYQSKQIFDIKKIEYLNTFDYILIGGGGLILPDSFPNKISCWQLGIPKELYSSIKKPVYVLSIGFNLFFNQNINMSNRNSNSEEHDRTMIFRENISKLIEISTHFSMRHKSDLENILSIIDNKYSEKIKLEYCPTIWYCSSFIKNNINFNKIYTAIEIKDDREWRRYYKIKKERFYLELEKFVIHCFNKKINIAYLSHDGSNDFFNYLFNKNIFIQYLDNSSGIESKIFDNYSKINTLICSAGQSQMIAHSLGINIITLVSHPKTKNFCDEVNNNNFIEINENFNVCDFLINQLE